MTMTPVDNSDVLRQLDLPRIGCGRIVSNDGGGVYTITELHWDGTAAQDAQAPGYLLQAAARDYLGRAAGQIGDVVHWWRQFRQDGTAEIVCDITAAIMPSAGMPSGSSGGDIIYHNGTKWVVLAAGTSEQVLTGGTTPGWTTHGKGSARIRIDAGAADGAHELFTCSDKAFELYAVGSFTSLSAGYINANHFKYFVGNSNTGTLNLFGWSNSTAQVYVAIYNATVRLTWTGFSAPYAGASFEGVFWWDLTVQKAAADATYS